MKAIPPKRPLQFLRWFCREDYLEEIEGDLTEVFKKQHGSNPRKARWKFTWSVIRYFRPEFIKSFKNSYQPYSCGMYKNYFKIGWRNIIQNSGHSILNIGGLALAMACSTVILLFVENELSFDRFHSNSGLIYRVVKDFVNEDGTKVPDATTPSALALALREELPDVERSTRFTPNRGRLYLLQYGDKRFYETRLISVDKHFFEVFDFPFIAGDKHSALNKIHSVILTESTAKKYFGDEDPLNKVIRMNLNNGTDFVVSGVLKDVPQNSHFTFDLIIPFESRRDPDLDWDRSGFYTYARLSEGANPIAFTSNVQSIVKKHKPNSTDQYYVQALPDIHLTSRLKWELAANGDSLNVKIMIAIGSFMILIASINYVNLVTAQSSKRAREIGVRKVSGASRGLLVRQFLAESILTTSISFAISILITLSFLPLTEFLFGYDLSLFLYQSKYVKVIPPAFALLVGIVAGIYPALYLSGFNPVEGLKGNLLNAHCGTRLRQGLVVFQFVISSTLIVGTLTIVQQLDFMKKKELGFDKDNVMLLPNVRGGIGSNVSDPAVMIEELKKIPEIMRIARADGVFGLNHSVNGVGTKNSDAHIVLNFIRADYDFLPALKIKVKEGRNFSEQFISDAEAIILNETAVAQLELKKPYIGQQLTWDDSEGVAHDVTVIGIAEDFHFNSFRETVKPFGFILEVGNGSTFFLKVQSGDLQRTIAAVESVWTKHNPEKPFEYSFQDEAFANLQLSEVRFQNLFSWFTILAIVITCLGMFGLITYMAGSKAKEIAVRKVLGASVNTIVVLLSRDFLRMAFISFIISFPLSYLLMNQWLRGFAYRSAIGWQVFAATVLATAVIVFVTVSFRAFKAAVMNPVKNLRSE